MNIIISIALYIIKKILTNILKPFTVQCGLFILFKVPNRNKLLTSSRNMLKRN